MRGQTIIFATVLVVLSLIAIYLAYTSVALGPLAPNVGGIYNMYRVPQEEVARTITGHVSYMLRSAAARYTGAVMDLGAFAMARERAYAKWYHVNVTRSHLDTLAEFFALNAAPLGTSLTGMEYYVKTHGFNGTLGAYPRRVEPVPDHRLFDLVEGGSVTFLRGSLAKLLVFNPGVSTVAEGYVVTYRGDVREPVVPGEPGNRLLAELLSRGVSVPGSPSDLFVAILAANRSAIDRCVDTGQCDPDQMFLQVAWWPEKWGCPICGVHVKVPAPIPPGGALELALYYEPWSWERYDSTTGTYLIYVRVRTVVGYRTLALQYRFNELVDPRAVFLYYAGPEDIAAWSRARTDTVVGGALCWNPPRGSVRGSVTVVTDPDMGRAVEVSALYSGGSTNWAFNVYKRLDDIRALYDPVGLAYPFDGFAVEAAVSPLGGPSVRPFRVEAWSPDSDPSRLHPVCAALMGIHALENPDIFTWNIRFLAGGAVWNGRSWDGGDIVAYEAGRWYLVRGIVDESNSRVFLQIYDYDTLTQIAGRTWEGAAGLMPTVYLVLGTAVVDVPASNSPWIDRARYLYVRVRPYVYPEPQAALVPVDYRGFPARAVWRGVLAMPRSLLTASMDLNLTVRSMRAELWELSTSLNLSVDILEAQVTEVDLEGHRVRYMYRVNVTTARPYLAGEARLYVRYTTSTGETTVQPLQTNVALSSLYWAVHEASVEVPTNAHHVVLVSLLGAEVAVSPGRPRAYVYGLGDGTYYIQNVGSGPLALLDTGDVLVEVDTRGFGDVLDVEGPARYVIVPPNTTVRVYAAAPCDYSCWRALIVPWQRDALVAVTNAASFCPGNDLQAYFRAFFPGKVSVDRYVVRAPMPIAGAGEVYALWAGSALAMDYWVEDASGTLWVKARRSHVGGWDLTGTSIPIIVCGGTDKGDPNAVFDRFLVPSGGLAPIYVSLVSYPDGVLVEYNVGSPGNVLYHLMLTNRTSIYSCSSVRRGDLRTCYNFYRGEYWWQYGDVYYDRHLWEREVPGGEYLFSIGLRHDMVLYRIFAVGAAGLDEAWVRGFPNSRGYRAYAYVIALPVCGDCSVRVRPFAWPEPFTAP